MWWSERAQRTRIATRLAVVLAAASLTAGCFEPLYGSRPTADSVSVRDKLGAVEIPVIGSRQGTPEQRIAVEMRNDLQFDLNGGAGTNAPTHRLEITVGATGSSVIVDVLSGRPTAQVQGITAAYQLVEIATGKVVLKDTAFAHVDYDEPGSQQRFAAQRAQRDAQDRATRLVAEAIRNRLASYFVAGT